MDYAHTLTGASPCRTSPSGSLVHLRSSI